MTKYVHQPNYKRATKEALDLLNQFSFDHPPINPVEIAEDLGVRVIFADFPEEYRNISGLYNVKNDSIYVNKKDDPYRQTFTIAHELGHKILHEEWVQSDDYRVLLRDQSLNVKDPTEQEANAFAAHLLVPKKFLDQYKNIASTEELAMLFAVSKQLIRNRVKFEETKSSKAS